jgi:hypothetical protein
MDLAPDMQIGWSSVDKKKRQEKYPPEMASTLQRKYHIYIYVHTVPKKLESHG